MSTQTYCNQDDIESIIGAAAVFASVDDEQDGDINSPTADHLSRIAAAIERGAVEINAAVRWQYRLSDVAANVWLKWANATLAAYFLRTRRNNSAEQSVIDAVLDIRSHLKEIRWGRDRLPDQLASFESTPTVSNFKPEMSKTANPIRVVGEESTGSQPGGGRRRNMANVPGNY